MRFEIYEAAKWKLDKPKVYIVDTYNTYNQVAI